MYQPLFSAGAAPGQAYLNAFGGLNRTGQIQDHEFLEMGCLSSGEFPFLSPSRERRQVCAVDGGIEAVIAPKLEVGTQLTAFTGVAGDKFYYNGVQKLTLTAQDGRRELVDFNGIILIFPDKKYYSYVDGSSGSIVDEMTGTIKFSSSRNEKEDTVSSTLTCAAGFGGKFKKGDSLSIQCESIPKNNTFQVTSKYDQPGEGDILSCVVAEVVSANTLMVDCYNRNGERMLFTNSSGATATVSRAMPDIVHACVANNRVMGVDGKGEFVFASKLGDFKNWNVFEGLSTDSWYGAVGTEGPFTGIATVGSSVAAFKHNYLHLLYGDSPQNFTLMRQISGGCIDGRSIADVSGQLFFLGYDGVYSFSGGNPVRVSEPLNCRYTAGVGGSDGSRYFLSALGAAGTELVVLDLQRGMWHREDAFGAVGFIKYNDRLYTADTEKLYEVGGGGYAGEWFAVSKEYDDGTMLNRAMINLYLRVKFLEDSAKLTIYASTDGGEWAECGSVSAERGRVQRVPVRIRSGTVYQWKIAGQGGAVVQAMERVVTTGGRNER